MKSKVGAGVSAMGAAVVLVAACHSSGLGSSSTSGSSGSGASSGTGSPGGTGGQSTASSGAGATMGTGGSGGAAVYPPLPSPPAQPELFYWHEAYLKVGSTTEPAASEALIDQAVAAGYTGLGLWDASVARLTWAGWDPSLLETVVAYATKKGLKILPPAAPYGSSNDLMRTNPNLAEGQRIVGSQFKVTGSTLTLVNSLPPVGNTGFESGNAVWFSFGDAGLDVDTSTAHSGSASAHFAASSSKNQRLTTPLTLTPFRQYHLGFWVKTAGFNGTLSVEALDSSNPSVQLDRLNGYTYPVQTDGDWTLYDVTFNSRESTQVLLYIGVWGGHQGDLWLDDIVLEETALVNILRRGGTPVKIYDPTTQATYAEGTDVAMIVDPAVAANGGNFDTYHTPPTIAVPSGSKLAQGQTIAIDSYAVVAPDGDEISSCMVEPDVHTWMAQNLAAIAGIFPKASSGIFLGYDEIRHMNSCALCRQQNLTAGQLLAWNVGRSVAEVNVAWPGAQLYVWSDMFDPYHNAVDNYYWVEGTIAGSWAGLPPGIIVMNWNLANLSKSLPWFAGKDPSGMQQHGFQQIIAGYYSAPDGGAEATTEMAAAMGVPGVIGAMYTTWDGNYTQMQQYADGVRSAWAAYRASVP